MSEWKIVFDGEVEGRLVTVKVYVSDVDGDEDAEPAVRVTVTSIEADVPNKGRDLPEGTADTAGPGGRKPSRMKSATTHMAALHLSAMQDVEVNLKLASNFFASHEARAWDMHSYNSPVNDPRWKVALANPAVTWSVRTGPIP